MVSFSGHDSLKLTFEGQDLKIRNPLIGGYLPLADSFDKLTPQNSISLASNAQNGNGKKKKISNQVGTTEHKPFKESSTTLKQDILNWLKNLPLSHRSHVCKIENATWLNILFHHMFVNWSTEKDTTFRMFDEKGPQHLANLFKKPTTMGTQIQVNAKDLFESVGLQKFCYIRNLNGGCSLSSNKEKHAELKTAEEELIQGLRILDGENYFDTLTIHEKLLENPDRLVQIFDIISNDLAFTNVTEKQADLTSKYPAWINPIWFTTNSFQRFGSWVASQLEKAIIYKYFEFKKKPSRLQQIYSDLEYKRKLTDFWNSLRNSQKKKLFITVHKILGMLKQFHQEKQRVLNSETLKDRKYYLYLFYKSFCDDDCKNMFNADNILLKFKDMIYEKDDIKFIENLLESPLSRFGNPINVIARRVSEKLRDCYANKMFETVNLNDKSFQGIFLEEEKVKPAVKKRKNKKKKSKSTKTSAASSQFTTPFALGVDLPQGSTGQPFSLEGNDANEPVSVKASDEIETLTLHMAHTLVENAVSGTDCTAETQNKPHSLAEETETDTNAEASLQHLTASANAKKNKKKKKKLIIEGSEALSTIHQTDSNFSCNKETESKKLLEPSESEIENKANVSATGESNRTFDLSIFDELNKKVSKNKKKKLRKKLKKERLKKGQSMEENNQTDSLSYLFDTKILRELSFHEKFENINETTCDQMWDTTTDGASIRTFVGAVGETGCQIKDKIDSLMSRSGTPNDESETEEKPSTQFSAANTEMNTERKTRVTMTTEEKKPIQDKLETNNQTDSFSEEKMEEIKLDKQKERFKLVPKNYKGNNTSFSSQSGASSLNNSSFMHRSQPIQQGMSYKGYEKNINHQFTECDLSGFTEVKGKKKKLVPVSNQMSSSTISREEQQRSFYPKYQYEEKKSKTYQSISRNSQQEISNIEENIEPSNSIKADGRKKQVHYAEIPPVKKVEMEQTVKYESQNVPQSVDPEQKQAIKGLNSSVQEPKISTLTKSDVKKKPLKLNPSAPPLKLGSALMMTEIDTQKKAAIAKVVNHLYEERIEKDINNYVKKLINESNVFEDYRRVTFNRLKHIIVNSLSGENKSVSVKPFGSCVTGLALNFSDIDLLISGIQIRDREHLLSLLQVIFEKLKVFGWVSESKVISTASLPVLKLDVSPSIDFSNGEFSGDLALKELMENISEKQYDEMSLKAYQKDATKVIRIDISIEDGNYGHIGVMSTVFVKRMTECHESLFSTTLVLKQLLSEKDLLNRHQGGISSYCLVVMLVAYLRAYEQPGIGKNFLQCIRYYGKEFDPKTTGINLFYEPSPIYNLLPHPHLEQSPFYLNDQLRFDRNIGHTTTKIEQILKEFSNLDDYFNSYRQAIEKIVVQNSWSTIQSIEYKALHSRPELQGFKNKNLFDEIFQVIKIK